MTVFAKNFHRSATKAAVSASAVAAALAFSAPAWSQSLFTNPGFETGDATGWELHGGFWFSINSDGTPTWPPPESDYSGPATQASIQTAGNVDPYTGAPVVFAGNYSMRLNDLNNDYSITALKQSVTNYAGNKLYYAWNAVLEPSHGATDSPSFIIKVVDKTTNSVINNISYSAYTAQNTTIFRNAGFLVTSDWKVEEIDMVSGHDYDMIFVALDCPYGGHRGYVYVDGFGNAIPVANADVDFDPLTDITRGASVLIPIGGTIPDIDLAKPFYTNTELANGQVNPKFVGGTLQADTAADVTNTFTVDTLGGTIDTNGFDVKYTGGFGGVGSLAKTGAGIATFDSMASTINGSLAINQGTVLVNDGFSALDVNVNGGGTLGGTGGVIANINVASGGTLAPGVGVGTLSVVAGRTALAGGSTFALDIDGRNYVPTGGAGTYDRLNMMAGSSFVAGGTIAPRLRGIAGGSNTFTPIVGDTFTVVNGGTVTGAFSAVAQPTSGLSANTRFDVIYRPSNIILALTPTDFGLWGAANGWKINAIRAAAALQGLRPTAGYRPGTATPTGSVQTLGVVAPQAVPPAAIYNLFDGLYGMNSAQLGYAFSQISGEIHSDALQMANSSARDVSQIAMSAVQEPWGCSPAKQQLGPFTEPAPESEDVGCGSKSTSVGPRVWGRWLYQTADVDEDSIAYGYERASRGLIAGVNVVNQDGTRLGLGGSFTRGDIRSDVDSSADFDTVSGFAYAAHRFGPLSVGAVFGYNKAKLETSRSVGLTTGTLTASDRYHIETLTGALEAKLDIELGKRSVLRPVAGIEFARNKADAVAESGSATIALDMPGEKWTSARTKLGAEAAVGVGNPVEVGVWGQWNHELKDTTAVRVAELNGATWLVSSVDAKKDTFEAGARLGIKITNAIKLQADYSLVRGGAYDADRATAGIAIRF